VREKRRREGDTMGEFNRDWIWFAAHFFSPASLRFSYTGAFLSCLILDFLSGLNY